MLGNLRIKLGSGSALLCVLGAQHDGRNVAAASRFMGEIDEAVWFLNPEKAVATVYRDSFAFRQGSMYRISFDAHSCSRAQVDVPAGLPPAAIVRFKDKPASLSGFVASTAPFDNQLTVLENIEHAVDEGIAEATAVVQRLPAQGSLYKRCGAQLSKLVSADDATISTDCLLSYRSSSRPASYKDSFGTFGTLCDKVTIHNSFQRFASSRCKRMRT